MTIYDQWFLLNEGQRSTYQIVYINARIIDPYTYTDIKNASLLTRGNKILAFGKELFGSTLPSGIDEVIDCKGKILMPGIVDIHVHFREPGQEQKETIATGSKAAAAGGVTTVVCQPNTVPRIEDVMTLRYVRYRARETAYINIECYGAITKNNTLSNMMLLKENGAVGFTDDGLPVMDSWLMKQAFLLSEQLHLPIAQHLEDLHLTRGSAINEGKVSTRLGVCGSLNIAESTMLARDLLIHEAIGGYYHVLHISTAEAVNLIVQAKQKNLQVTCEVTPHHFILTDEAVLKHKSLAKMNPPLRSEKDRQMIINGLREGIIDCIATDHAPHEAVVKDLPLEQAAFGIIGLETLLPLTLELYYEHNIPLRDVLAKLTCNPARVINKDYGRIYINGPADLVLFDPDKEWVINIHDFASKSRNSPFHNRKVRGKVLRTIVQGKSVYIAG